MLQSQAALGAMEGGKLSFLRQTVHKLIEDEGGEGDEEIAEYQGLAQEEGVFYSESSEKKEQEGEEGVFFNQRNNSASNQDFPAVFRKRRIDMLNSHNEDEGVNSHPPIGSDEGDKADKLDMQIRRKKSVEDGGIFMKKDAVSSPYLLMAANLALQAKETSKKILDLSREMHQLRDIMQASGNNTALEEEKTVLSDVKIKREKDDDQLGKGGSLPSYQISGKWYNMSKEFQGTEVGQRFHEIQAREIPLKFLHLRRLNRTISQCYELQQQLIEDMKIHITRASDKIISVQYELAWFKRRIAEENSYATALWDSVREEMIPEKTYIELAAEQPDFVPKEVDPHAFTINWIAFDTKERERCKAELDILIREREVADQKLAVILSKENELPAKLAALEKAVEDITSACRIDGDKAVVEMPEAAKDLPGPLLHLFSRFFGYMQLMADSTCSISVEEEPLKLISQETHPPICSELPPSPSHFLSLSAAANSSSPPSDLLSTASASSPPPTTSEQLSQAPLLTFIEENNSSLIRGGEFDEKSSKKSSKKLQEGWSVYQVYPKKVVLTLFPEKNEKCMYTINSQQFDAYPLKLTFQYLPQLELVIVKTNLRPQFDPSQSQAILCGLLEGDPKDNGVSSPNPANYLNELPGGLFDCKKTAGAKPFRWAQSLGGIKHKYVLPGFKPLVEGLNLHQLIKKIRERTTHRMWTLFVVDQCKLNQRLWPEHKDQDNEVLRTLSRPSTKLRSFEVCTLKDYEEAASFQSWPEELVGSLSDMTFVKLDLRLKDWRYFAFVMIPLFEMAPRIRLVEAEELSNKAVELTEDEEKALKASVCEKAEHEVSIASRVLRASSVIVSAGVVTHCQHPLLQEIEEFINEGLVETLGGVDGPNRLWIFHIQIVCLRLCLDNFASLLADSNEDLRVEGGAYDALEKENLLSIAPKGTSMSEFLKELNSKFQSATHTAAVSG